jgi:hypothetical protein
MKPHIDFTLQQQGLLCGRVSHCYFLIPEDILRIMYTLLSATGEQNVPMYGLPDDVWNYFQEPRSFIGIK